MVSAVRRDLGCPTRPLLPLLLLRVSMVVDHYRRSSCCKVVVSVGDGRRGRMRTRCKSMGGNEGHLSCSRIPEGPRRGKESKTRSESIEIRKSRARAKEERSEVGTPVEKQGKRVL